MPHILVLGATGTVGNPLAQSLVRSGNHTVYGLARTPAKAKSLFVQEIIPVQGSAQEPEAILDLLDQHPEISVVVDAAAVYGDSVTLLNHILDAGRKRLAKYRAVGVPAGPKLGYVYVSGMWVHGSSPAAVSDQDAFVGTSAASTPAAAMLSWRPEIERLVVSPLTQAVLDTAVVRPALTFGGPSAIWTGYFAAALQAARAQPQPDSVAIPLDARAAAPLVHVDDVAAGIQAVIEKLPLFAGTGVYPVFDFVAQVESVAAIMEAAARVFGFNGAVRLVGSAEGDVFADAFGSSVVGDSGKAKTLLGWAPRKKGFLQGVHVYAGAWLAGFEKN